MADAPGTGRPLRPDGAREGAERVGPGARRPAPTGKQHNTLVERGGPVPTRRLLGLLVGGLLLAFAAAPAQAAPVTVNLRVEGPTRTLFEGPVTTDVAPFKFSDSAADLHLRRHRRRRRPERRPRPHARRRAGHGRRAARLRAARQLRRSSARASRASRGEDVGYDAATGRYLVEYHDGKPDDLGACSRQIADGDEELFAYGTGTEPVLKLDPRGRPGRRRRPRRLGDPEGRPTPRPARPSPGRASPGRPPAPTARATVGPLPRAGRRPSRRPRTARSAPTADAICVTDGADGAVRRPRVAAARAAGAVRHEPATRAARHRDRRPTVGRIASIAQRPALRRRATARGR